jgi:hypothetical protein
MALKLRSPCSTHEGSILNGARALALSAAALLALATLPAAASARPLDRAHAADKALTALQVRDGDAAITVFGLTSTVPAGTSISQAGPAGSATAPSARAPVALARAGVEKVRAGSVARTHEPTWVFYADRGPDQAFEHPGQIALVGRDSGKVRVTRTLRWIPLVDGRLPAFFRTPQAYAGKHFRILARPWKERARAAAATAHAAAVPEGGRAAAQRLADALAAERSCALRVSDTLGDFSDYARVDKTRAALGRELKDLSKLNRTFISDRYVASDGRTPMQSAQALIERGCKDLFVYVAGSATRSGTAGVVVGIRPLGGRAIEWHTLSASALEALVQANRGVTFKFVFDAPYAGRIAQQLSDESNVSVLLTAGGASEASFTYLPRILGPTGLLHNTSNPYGLLDFTNTIIQGMGRFVGSPAEIDTAIAMQATGRTDSVMAWMIARSLQLGPSPFSASLMNRSGQRLPLTTAAPPARPTPPSPVNHTPNATTPTQVTREDTPRDVTLTAVDPDGDPLTFEVTVPPAHGALTGTAPFLRYVPARDFAGDDALTYRVSDGRGGTDTRTVGLTVTPDNDAPALVSGPSAVPPTYTEKGTPVVVDDTLTVNDPDSPQLAGGRVDIPTGFTAGDELTFTAQPGISGAYDAATGVLTLSGSASQASYRSLVRSVQFASASDDPGTARTIRFRLDDSGENGTPASRSVTVVPTDDAPVHTLPAPQTAVEDVTKTITGLSVADADAGSAPLRTQLTVSHGSLTLATTSGLTFAAGDGTDDATMTFTGTRSAIDAALDGLRYRGAADFAGDDGLHIVTSDQGATGSGGPLSADDTLAIAVGAVNDAPKLVTSPGTGAYTEGATPAAVDSAVALTDVDDGELASASVTISGGRESGDTLTFTAPAGIDGSYDATSGVLTFTPTGPASGAPVADFRTALRSVTFATANDDPSTTRSFSFDASDGDDDATPATRGLTITAVDDAATVATSAGSAAYSEDDATGVVADPDVTVADPDDTHLEGATVAISANRDDATDELTFAAQNGITGVFSAGTLTLTGHATTVQYETALQTVRFRANGDAVGGATRTLTFRADDGDGLGNGDTRDVTVSPSNDAPVDAVPSGTQTVTENATLTFGTVNGLSVSDADAAGDALQVTLGVDHGTLTLGDAGGLTFAGGDGTADPSMTFTGTASAVNAALANTTYSPSPGYAGSDTLTMTTSDLGHNPGPAQTDTDTVDISVLALNRAPVNDVPGGQAVDEDGALAFSTGGGNAISVSDVDGGSDDEQVTLSVDHGTLTLGQTTGLSFTSGDGVSDAAMTFTGSLSDLNAALAGTTYTPAANFNGTDTLTITTDDLGHNGEGGAQSDTDTVGITVGAGNDAPVNTVPVAQTVAEDGTLTFSDAGSNALSTSDADAGAGSVEIELTATDGTVALGSLSDLSVTGNGTSHLTATGSLSAVNAGLQGTAYSPAADFAGDATLTVKTDDLGNTGADGAKTDTDAVTVHVSAVNDAPSVSVAESSAEMNQDSTLVLDSAHAGAVAIQDVDAGSGAIELTLTATHGTLDLSRTTGLTFTAGDGAHDATMTFTGTRANVNGAIDGLRYTPGSGYFGDADLDLAVDDQGNTGTGDAKSATGHIDVTIHEANTAPVNTVPDAQWLTEDTTLTFTGASQISVADANVPSTGGGDLQVHLQVDDGTLTLSRTTGLTFTSGTNGSGDLVVRGTPADLNAALDGLAYQPAANATADDELTVTSDDLGQSGPPGALTDSDSVTLHITAVNDAPLNVVPSAQSVDEDAALTFSTANGNVLAFSDVDGDDDPGPIQVLLSVTTGKLTLPSTSGLTFVSGTNGGATFRVSGTPSDVNAALDGVKYDPPANFSGSATLTMTSDDRGRTGSGGIKTDTDTVTISVAAQNDAPVGSVPGAQTIDEDTTLTLSGANAPTISDADATDAAVTLTATDGTLTLPSITGLTFSAGDGTADATMTFTGTIATINARLDGLAYTPTANFNGSASITLTTNDQGGTGSGGAQSDTDAVAVTVSSVNDAPALAQPDSAALAYTEDAPTENHADAVAPSLTVNDVDDATLSGATVTISANKDTGDVLAVGTPGSLTVAYNSATGVLSLSGAAALATYQTALRSVTYATTSDSPSSATRTLSFRADDGHAANRLSAAVSRDVVVTPTNDAPVADGETFNGADGAVGNTTLVVDDPSDGAPAAPDPTTTSPVAARPHKTITGSILTGDADPDGPGPLVVGAGTFATNDGGTVTLQSDGDFTFEPAPATSCTDTSDFFDYTVSDSASPASSGTGRVTIAISGCVHYVNNDAPGNSGTSAAPFDTLAQAQTASSSGDSIFVYRGDTTSTNGYDAGIDLKANQRLLGGAATLTVGSDTLWTGDPAQRPTITDTANDVVVLAAGNTVRGLDLNPAGGGGIAGGTGDAGGTIADVKVTDTGAPGTRPGLDLNGTSGTFNVSNLTVDNSAATTVPPSTAKGVSLNNAGTVDFASAGTISITTKGARGLDATGTDMGAGSVFDDITVTGSGTGGVALTSTTGKVDLGDGANTDLSLQTTSGAAPALSLANAAGVTVGGAGTDNLSATGGPALDVAFSSTPTTGPTLAFDDVDSANSAGDGINLDSLGNGTFSAVTGDVGGAAGIGFDLNGGSGAITYPGAFANGSGLTAVELTGRTGGVVSLSGSLTDTADTGGGVVVANNTGGASVLSGATKQFNTGASDAVSFTNSDGHTFVLSGGGTDIDTTTGNGLTATTAGTVQVSGSGNTIDTGSGRGLNISDTDIAAADVMFQRISSNGAVNGIRVNNSATVSGRLFVTGVGGTCQTGSTGGCSGGAIVNATGAGVLLNGLAGGAELMRLNVTDAADQGIDATSVANGILLDRSVVQSNGTTTTENGVDLNDVTGVSAIRSSDLIGSGVANDGSSGLDVTNTTGTLHLTVDDNDINLASTDDGIQVTGGGTAQILSNITGNRFDDNKGDAIQIADQVSSTVASNHTITGNTISGKPGTATDGGIVVSTDGTSHVKVDGNTVTGVSVSGIILNPDGSASSAQFDGTASNNAIGTAGAEQSGSEDGDGMQLKSASEGQSRIAMNGNAIRGWQGAGMRMRASEATSGVSNAVTQLTAQGNTIGDEEAGNADAAIWLQAGSSSTDVLSMCANVGGAGGLANTFTTAPVSAPAGIADFVLDLRFPNAQMRVPGYTGTTSADRQNYFLGRNGLFTNFAQDGSQNMTNEVDGSCDQPSAPATPTAPPAIAP